MMHVTTAAGAAATTTPNMGPPETISLVLSILAALALAWREIATRRKLKAEAGALDLKTPAEVDNLNATTHTQEINRVLAFNEQLLKNNAELTTTNKDLRSEMDGMRTEINTVLQNQRTQDEHARRLERWLEQAYSYIEDLLAWVDRHVPGAVPPVPPRNYRPTFHRENQDTTHP